MSDEDDAHALEQLGANVYDDRKLGLTILNKGMVCEFLKDGRCSIYAARPAACREFDCRDSRRYDSVLFEDFPDHLDFIKKNS